MFGMFKSMLGGSNEALTDALRNGATIIDVRSPGEYAGGHVAGSKNIPLQQIPDALGKFPTSKPIVFCCASGGRSGQATDFANAKGYTAVNGGPWTTVNRAVAELAEGGK
jgi:phage shock protein E